MREIKFRAWNMKTNTMDEYIYDLTFKEGETHKEIHLYQDEILMQYTGLKDKNGVEIYEGDIITNDDFKDIGTITFSIGCFRAYDFTLANFEAIHQISRIEVIGNIYEHKGLLDDTDS